MGDTPLLPRVVEKLRHANEVQESYRVPKRAAKQKCLTNTPTPLIYTFLSF